MPNPIYVPVLKGKEGEFSALEVLDVEIKRKIMPLIEVPEIPYDFAMEAAGKSLDEHINNIPERLFRACGTMPFYLDLTWLKKNEILSNGQAAFAVVLTKLSELGCQPVPVLYRESSSHAITAAHAHARLTDSGVCIRLLVDDFDDEIDLDAEVQRLLTTVEGRIEIADLVLDLDDLGASKGPASILTRSLFSLIPQKDTWRRIILAAASFPEDLSDVGAATVVTLPRVEWRLWKTLQKRPSALPRAGLIFGDYAMAHPVGKALDPRTMRMSANIRYTTEDDWLIIKGRNVKQYGFGQYFEMCRTLIGRPEFRGRGYSWGDRYIGSCADATEGPGNATTWRKVGVNHHITLVTREISSLTNVA